MAATSNEAETLTGTAGRRPPGCECLPNNGRGHTPGRRAPALAPRNRVVILSQHADALYALALFDDGSDGRGYLLKDRVRDQAELSRALLEVSRGGTVVDAKVATSCLRCAGSARRLGLETLTDREQEILALVAEGRSNGDIAETLVVTKRAVEGHINSIFSSSSSGSRKESIAGESRAS